MAVVNGIGPMSVCLALADCAVCKANAAPRPTWPRGGLCHRHTLAMQPMPLRHAASNAARLPPPRCDHITTCCVPGTGVGRRVWASASSAAATDVCATGARHHLSEPMCGVRCCAHRRRPPPPVWAGLITAAVCAAHGSTSVDRSCNGCGAHGAHVSRAGRAVRTVGVASSPRWLWAPTAVRTAAAVAVLLAAAMRPVPFVCPPTVAVAEA